jgi:hypothetical protein
MAEGKKTFQMYTDYLMLMEELTITEKGEVFQWVMEYVNDKNPDYPEDRLVRTICKEIQTDLKRDLKKWEEKCQKNRQNGSKGGRPKKQTDTEKTERFYEEPKKADKDKDKDKDINKAVIKISESQVDELHKLTCKIFDVTEELNARLYMDIHRWIRSKSIDVEEFNNLSRQTKFYGEVCKHNHNKYRCNVKNWMSDKWNLTDYKAQFENLMKSSQFGRKSGSLNNGLVL